MKVQYVWAPESVVEGEFEFPRVQLKVSEKPLIPLRMTGLWKEVGQTIKIVL